MAKQTKQSTLANYLSGKGGNKSFKDHKGDATVYQTGGNLPAGIDNGIAQLKDCRFGTYKTGPNAKEMFFLAQGTVVQPDMHDGQRVRGLNTMIMEPMCDTPTRSRQTTDDHLAWVLNELRKLGINTEEDVGDVTQLEGVCEALVDDAPYFSFRTWVGKATPQFPNPQVNDQWVGLSDYVETNVNPDGEVVDNTEDSDVDDSPTFRELGVAADEDDVEAETALIKAAEAAGIDHKSLETWTDVAEALVAAFKDDDAEGKGDDADDVMEEIDYAALGAKADEGDEEAEAILTEAAEEAKIDHLALESWTEVAALLTEDVEPAEVDDDNDTDGEGEEEDQIPAKGEFYGYRAPRRRKSAVCKVTGVFVRQQTANLQNMEDKELSYKSVPWDKLEEV